MAKGAIEKCRYFLPCNKSGRQELKKEEEIELLRKENIISGDYRKKK